MSDKKDRRGGLFLFQAFFQCGGIEGGQVDALHAVLRRQDEGFGQVIAGHHGALLLRPVKKCHGPLGGGGVVHVENADDGPVPHRHVIADG